MVWNCQLNVRSIIGRIKSRLLVADRGRQARGMNADRLASGMVGPSFGSALDGLFELVLMVELCGMQ